MGSLPRNVTLSSGKQPYTKKIRKEASRYVTAHVADRSLSVSKSVSSLSTKQQKRPHDARSFQKRPHDVSPAEKGIKGPEIFGWSELNSSPIRTPLPRSPPHPPSPTKRKNPIHLPTMARPADTLNVNDQHTPVLFDDMAELAENGQLLFVRQGPGLYQAFSHGEVERCVNDKNINPVTNQPNLSGAPMLGPINFEEIQRKKQQKAAKAEAHQKENQLVADVVELFNDVFVDGKNIPMDRLRFMINCYIQHELRCELSSHDTDLAANFANEVLHGTPPNRIECPVVMSAKLRKVIKIIRRAAERGHILRKKEQRDEAKREERERKNAERRAAKEQRDEAKREEKERVNRMKRAVKRKRDEDRATDALTEEVQKTLAGISKRAKAKECAGLIGQGPTDNVISAAIRGYLESH